MSGACRDPGVPSFQPSSAKRRERSWNYAVASAIDQARRAREEVARNGEEDLSNLSAKIKRILERKPAVTASTCNEGKFMNPMLDDIELIQVQEIGTYDKRVLAEHKPPGMAGSLLQNLGRRPPASFCGVSRLVPTLFEFTEKLDDKFRAGKPVPFTADIVSRVQNPQVFIDDLRFQDLAGKPERFAYVLTLREFIEPVEPARNVPP